MAFKDNFDYQKFHGLILDAFDGLPNDLKAEVNLTDLGKLIEARLQQTDNVYCCDECDGRGYYFIDGMKQACICSESQTD